MLRKYVTNMLIACCSILFSGMCIELGFRVYYDSWEWVNFTGVGKQYDRLRGVLVPGGDRPWILHERLGWIPEPGQSIIVPHWNDAHVTILEHGIRSNGNAPTRDSDTQPQGVIVAVGDSFTFGDEVSDHQTWPAILETLIPYTVMNGGVFGYGMDQSFLRATMLIKQYHPDMLIFSLIPQDIHRCEFAVSYGIKKPYFRLTKAGEVVLENFPVPPPASTPPRFDIVRQVFGYSLCCHRILGTLFPTYWYTGRYNLRVHSDGDMVACVLMHALAELSAQTATHILVLLQYDTLDEPVYIKQAEHLVRCVPEKLALLDLKPALQAVRAQNAEEYARFFNGHMTERGNRFVAEQIALFLKTQNYGESPP